MLFPPTFDGNLMFGETPQMATPEAPRDTQITVYPGLTGLALKDLGGRGRMTYVKGRLVAPDPGSLFGAMQLFRNYHNNNAYLLTDTLGVQWPLVVLQSFEPQMGTFFLDSLGFLSIEYTASFRHLA